MKVSFIGLGIMGLPMAKHLQKAGKLTKVYNRTRSKAGVFEGTDVQVANSPKEAAETADLVITMVSDSSDSEDVILGPEGVIHGAQPGAIIVDMSSINPEVSKQIGRRLGEKGIDFLDAPVSGGEQGAIAGALAIMVGGNKTSFQKVEPILKVFGKSVTHLGPLGMGGYAKLANQIIVGIEMQAMAEAFTLAKEAGLDFEALYEAIRYGLAGSHVLDQKIRNLIDGNFNPGFTIELHEKDLRNTLLAAKTLGISLPFTEQVRQMMHEMIEAGEGGLDHSGLYKRMGDSRE